MQGGHRYSLVHPSVDKRTQMGEDLLHRSAVGKTMRLCISGDYHSMKFESKVFSPYVRDRSARLALSFSAVLPRYC